MAGLAFECGQMQDMGDVFPVTLNSLNHLITLQEDDFLTYVVCPKCDSVYNNCFEVRRNGLKESKCCSHKQFPNHPQRSHRKPCGATLLKNVKTKHGLASLPLGVIPTNH